MDTQYNKKFIIFTLIFVLIVLVGYFLFKNFSEVFEQSLKNGEKSVKLEMKDNNKPMNLTSPVFKNNENIPKKYTCDGENINPPFEIFGAPENAKSLVLIVDDPDAPMGTWVHWTVWNIDPKTKKIEENSVPLGAMEGMTSFKKFGYGGPCPSSGAHHYYFKLYAIDTALALSNNADKLELEKEINDRILDHAELVGLYLRDK